MTEAARNSLRMRYRLLPYLYTLFYHSRAFGSTVARPLVHEWPKDENTADIKEQFLWGRSLLISPLIHEVINKSIILEILTKNIYEIKPNIVLIDDFY